MVVGFGVSVVKFEGLSVVGNRLLVVTLLVVGSSSLAVGLSEWLVVKFDGSCVVGNRGLIVLLCVVSRDCRLHKSHRI